MSEKKYYWLKLKNDFFNQPKIKKLRRIAGGDTYTLIYLKLQLLSLQKDGVLIFEGIEDNFVEEMALNIDEDVENVKITLSYLLNQGLLEEVSCDTFLLPETIKNIGSETRQAEIMRRKRAIKSNNVTPMLHSVTQSKSKELDKELDKESFLDKPKKSTSKKPTKTNKEKMKDLVGLTLEQFNLESNIENLFYAYYSDRIDKGEKISSQQVEMQLEECMDKTTSQIFDSLKNAIAGGYKKLYFNNSATQNKKNKDTAYYDESDKESLERTTQEIKEQAPKLRKFLED